MRQPTLYELARYAFEQGFLDLRALLDLVYEAGRVGQGARLPDFWVRPGRLTPLQFDVLLAHFSAANAASPEPPAGASRSPSADDAGGMATMTLTLVDLPGAVRPAAPLTKASA